MKSVDFLLNPISLAAVVIMTLLMMTAGAVAEETGLKTGDQVPAFNFELISTSGDTVKMADMKGKRGLLVVFLAEDCPSCIAWRGRINASAETFMKNNGNAFFVNSNDPKKMPKMFWSWRFPRVLSIHTVRRLFWPA